MKSDGHVFFRDSTRQLPELSISLELGEGPAAVSASFVQEDGAADDPAPCLRSISQRVRGYRDFRIIDHCDYPSRRPRSIIIACGDGNYQLRKLRWRRWNGNVATGRGTAYANNCIPYCAAGHFVAYPVRLRAYRPRKMGDGDYTYTRLRIVYPGSRPPGNPGHEI